MTTVNYLVLKGCSSHHILPQGSAGLQSSEQLQTSCLQNDDNSQLHQTTAVQNVGYNSAAFNSFKHEYCYKRQMDREHMAMQPKEVRKSVCEIDRWGEHITKMQIKPKVLLLAGTDNHNHSGTSRLSDQMFFISMQKRLGGVFIADPEATKVHLKLALYTRLVIPSHKSQQRWKKRSICRWCRALKTT